MNKTIYKLKNINLAKPIRTITLLGFAGYLPISFYIIRPSEWGLGSALLMTFAGYIGTMAIFDIYYGSKWFFLDAPLFLFFWIYLSLVL